MLHLGSTGGDRGVGVMVLQDSLLCNEGLGVSGRIVQPASGKLAPLGLPPLLGGEEISRG